MADERIIFKGNPSTVSILGSLLVCVILFLAGSIGLILYWNKLSPGPLRQVVFWLPLIPLLFLVGKWTALKFLSYEITSERIKITKGLLSKRTDELELYRVKDTSLVEPFLYRMFSVGNIVIITGDASTPTVELRAINHAKEIREQLRVSIEECRGRKRTGIVELE